MIDSNRIINKSNFTTMKKQHFDVMIKKMKLFTVNTRSSILECKSLI